MRPATERVGWARAAAFALIALLAGGRPAEARTKEPTIRIVGYNDMDEMLTALTRRYRARHPAVRFHLDLRSTRSAPPALLDGSADLAPMGAEMDAGQRASIRARWGGEPIAIAVAHDSVTPGALSSPTGVFVHRDNPLGAISLADLRRLFGAGATPATWRSLGVAMDGPIRPMGLGGATAIGGFLLDRIIGSARFAQGYREFPQSREAAAAIAATPGALGFANLNHAGPGIRALDIVDDRGRRWPPTARSVTSGGYPLDRRLLIYARRDRAGRIAPRLRAFLSFVLSEQGQRIIAKGAKGYLPLAVRTRAVERAKLHKVQ